MDASKLCELIVKFQNSQHEFVGFDSTPLVESLFRQHVLSTEPSDGDDLVFFVLNERPSRLGSILGIPSKSEVVVYRQSSTNLPLKSVHINWHDTTLLNVVLQKFEYNIHLAVCTQTSARHFQILHRQKIVVHASPSQHSVISKGVSERYSYPEINFAVDDYEDFLHKILVGGLETVFVELSAHSADGKDSKLLFSTAIHYEALTEACSKKNFIKRNGQSFGLIRTLDSESGTRAEFIIKKKIRRSTSDGLVLSECSTHLSSLLLPQDNLALDLYLLSRNRRIRINPGQTHHGLEIELCDLFSHTHNIKHSSSDDNNNNNDDNHIEPLESEVDPWTQRGFEQSLAQCRTAIRASRETLHVCVTRIALPIHSILERIIQTRSHSSQPALSSLE